MCKNSVGFQAEMQPQKSWNPAAVEQLTVSTWHKHWGQDCILWDCYNMGNPSFRGVPVVFCVWNWKLLYKHWDICLVGRIVPMEISFLFPFFLLHSWFRCMSFISYLKIFTILMVVDASPNPPGFGWDFASLLLWMWPDPLSKSQCCGILEPGQGTAT